jgi:hypothetical protein
MRETITEAQPMIARRWRGRVRAADHDTYLRFVEETWIPVLRATRGNEGVIVFRRLDDATRTSEFEVVSLWRDLRSIETFAGANISVAQFVPDDDRFLVERELTVHHDEVDVYPAQGG